MELLRRTRQTIEGLDQDMMTAARERLDSLTKPPGSLGKLEELAVKLAGISGQLYPRVDHKVHILMAADHGVVAEGVSIVPQAVTTQMVYNFINGGAAINVLCRQVGADLRIVDIGVAQEIHAEGVIVKKIRPGTDNLAQGPAMTTGQAIASIEAGIEVAAEAIAAGANLIGTGEMGIGNTTPSSAILAVMTDHQIDEVVGYGTGITEEQLQKKREVVAQSIRVTQPDASNGIDVLAKVGGLEIGGMAGVMLGAAARSVPVMIDGFISGAAAMIAYSLEPGVADYLISSHTSVEPGHIKIYELLGLEPMLDLGMRLGEGTGAVLAMPLVESATRIIREMATFEEAQLDADNLKKPRASS